MRFCYFLVSSFLFISVAPADPREHGQPRVLARTAPNSVFAGAVLDTSNTAFRDVSSSLIVPSISGDSGSVAAAWIGIGGSACKTILRVGVYLEMNDNGPSFTAWSQLYPSPEVRYPKIPISAGDVIELYARTTSSMSGVVILTNHNNNVSVVDTPVGNQTICASGATWIVQAKTHNDLSNYPLPNFTTITFHDAVATDLASASSPSFPGGYTVDIEQNNQNLTSSLIRDFSVVVAYV